MSTGENIQEPSGEFSPETPESTGPDAPGDILQTVIAERDGHWEKYLRAEAELDNYRRRVNRERDEERKYAALPVIRDLLPAMDNLQRALDAGQGAGGDALLQGVDMVLRQMRETIARHGARIIPAVGETFDPNRHEALTQVPTPDHPPLTILQEVEPGYMLHDRVIRPGKVIVASAP